MIAMTTNKKTTEKKLEPIKSDFFDRLWEQSWTYIKTVVDVVHEPILVLDKNLRVMAANEAFYRTFQVEHSDTEGRVVYELGNGQWNIPALRKLLEDILPKNTFFKGFEVIHQFPVIGDKIMILNAREIHPKENSASGLFPPIILLAIEDVTEMMNVAKNLADHTNRFQVEMAERTGKLEIYINELKQEVRDLKERI